jgi:pre-mRNA-processing factor 6
MGLEDQDRRTTWSDDAKQCLARVRQSLETARAIYSHMLSIFPEKEAIWIQAAKLEKQYGTRKSGHG